MPETGRCPFHLLFAEGHKNKNKLGYNFDPTGISEIIYLIKTVHSILVFKINFFYIDFFEVILTLKRKKKSSLPDHNGCTFLNEIMQNSTSVKTMV